MAEHDQLFKAIFERRSEAESLLASCLPHEVSAAIDWATLEPLSPALSAPDLLLRQTDLLFSVRVAGKEARLIVLMEHQSSVDSNMPLRVLGYMLRIWERHRRDAPGAPLPLVLPVVVYQAPRRGTRPRACAR